MTPWDLIQAIFKKQKLVDMLVPDVGISITLNKWLGFHPATAKIIKPLIPFTFYVEPLHYYYLLFFSVPFQYPPSLFRPKKLEVKENKLLNKVQYVLNCTDKEMLKSKELLNLVILGNEEHWKKELCVK